MTPQSAKAKGRRLQQWVAARLLYWFSWLSEKDVRSTSMGAGGIDVQLSQAAHDAFPYAIECKNKKAFAVYTDYEQACDHCETIPGAEPLLVIKANEKQPLVVVDAEHFFELVWKQRCLEQDQDDKVRPQFGR